MRIFFIISFILMIADLCLILHIIKTGKAGRNQGIAFGITCFQAVMAIAESAGFFSFDGTFQFMGIVSTAAFLLLYLYQKKPAHTIPFAIKAMTVAAVLELTLFNIPTYRVFFGGYETRTLNASDAWIESESSYLNDKGSAADDDNNEIVMTYQNVNLPIRTVSADITFSSISGAANFVIDIKDATQRGDYRYNICEDQIVAKSPTSNYATLDVSGAVSDIRVKFRSVGEGTVSVQRVTLNALIPFEIYYVRFLFLVLTSVLLYGVLKTSFLSRSYQQAEKFCRICTLAAAVVCSIATICIMNYKLPDDTTWKERIENDGGNQVSRELVLAFEQGHVYLDAQPTQELLEMEEPYERWTRDKQAGYEWDHVLYDGKYYSYYGVAPVLLWFWPFYKLTKHYCPSELAILPFAIVGFFGLACFLMKVIKKWFSGIPSGMYLLAMLMMFLNCGAWYSIGRPDFYEVAMISGFCFMIWGCYFLLSANILGDGSISLPKTAIASLLLAIAVLCRPTLVLYCICAAVFMILAAGRSAGENQKFGNQRSIFYLLCAFVPMGVLGLGQMWYNYARFGSPFEFGIQYSLTINNFTKTEFHPALSWIAVYNYLFNAPVFSMRYPEIVTEYQDMGVNGFFYHDLASERTSGLFWLMPPLLAYLFSRKALRLLPERKNKLFWGLVIAVPCVLIPVGIIASVWESGYSARYMSDFAWQMIIGAYAVIFFLYQHQKNETVRKGFSYFFCFSFVWTMLISGVQLFDFTFRYVAYHWDFPEMAYIVDRLFRFWR